MSAPARGPQPVRLADGSTAYSSGAVHTLLIRAADRLRATRTISPQGDHMSKYRDSLDDKGKADLDAFTAARKANPGAWLTEDNVPATRENTDARVWEAMQTPFHTPDQYR